MQHLFSQINNMNKTTVNTGRKPGRPIVSDKNKRKYFAQTALTSTEFATYIQLAKRAHQRPSVFLRDRIFSSGSYKE